MHRIPLLAFFLAATISSTALSQAVTVPNAPALVEEKITKYKIAIQVPRTWKRLKANTKEILARTGTIDGIESTCMVRLTSISELQNITPQDFVNSMSKERFLEGTLMSGAKPEVHIFDTALLGGIVARRIIHTQAFNGTPLTYISHQALRGADVFTVTCYANQADFSRVMSTFGMIIGTTRFLP